MTDAALIWNQYGADVTVSDGDLLHDDGLAPAVMISLFTDARADETTPLPGGETDRRGWWSDAVSETTTGSLLWLVGREKTVPGVAERVRAHCETALAWLVEDGIASEVEIDTEIHANYTLHVKIVISRASTIRHTDLWRATKKYDRVVAQDIEFDIKFEDD